MVKIYGLDFIVSRNSRGWYYDIGWCTWGCKNSTFNLFLQLSEEMIGKNYVNYLSNAGDSVWNCLKCIPWGLSLKAPLEDSSFSSLTLWSVIILSFTRARFTLFPNDASLYILEACKTIQSWNNMHMTTWVSELGKDQKLSNTQHDESFIHRFMNRTQNRTQ